MTDEVADQASQQSVQEKIASKFGLGAVQQDPEVTARPAADLAELEWDGEKYQVPVKLKDAFMKNQDYTQKTQELADQRRSVDHLRELTQTRQLEAAFAESTSGEQREIALIEAYLEQAGRLDWANMTTDQIMRQRLELDNVKERRQKLKEAIAEKRTKFMDEVQSKLKDLRGKSREQASKSIPGFTEETEKTVRTYAQSEGLSEAEIDNVLLDPRSYRVLWKAAQFERVKSQAKPVEAPQKVLKPGASENRMPAETAAKLNFRKALNSARTSAQKASVIEQRLEGIFTPQR